MNSILVLWSNKFIAHLSPSRFCPKESALWPTGAIISCLLAWCLISKILRNDRLLGLIRCPALVRVFGELQRWFAIVLADHVEQVLKVGIGVRPTRALLDDLRDDIIVRRHVDGQLRNCLLRARGDGAGKEHGDGDTTGFHTDVRT